MVQRTIGPQILNSPNDDPAKFPLAGASLVLAGTALVALVACQPAKESSVTDQVRVERVSYISSNVDFFRDVFAGRLTDDTVELHGRLHLPEGDGRFPVVIYQHGSSSPHSTNTATWRKLLRERLAVQGIGFFIADSYSGRGIGETSRDQSKLSRTSRVIDTLRALEALSRHPRIDRERIGIAGQSVGGRVSFMTSHEPFAEAILPDGLRFAAHLPLYPGCTSHFEHYRPTGAPLLFLLGGADDYTAPEPCLAQIDDMKRAAVPVDVVVYPRAHHGFNSSRPVRWNPNAWHFNDCPHAQIGGDGELRTAVISSEGMTWLEYVRSAAKICGKRGVHIGRNAEAAHDALERAVSFFAAHLK